MTSPVLVTNDRNWRRGDEILLCRLATAIVTIFMLT